MEATTKKPTAKCIEELERVIGKLETWQNKYHADEANWSGSAKDDLFRLLRDLRDKRDAPAGGRDE